MEVPHATEIRSITIGVRDSARVDFYLDKIIHAVKAEARKGESEVIITESEMKIGRQNIHLDIACQTLVEKGFSVENYVGSDTEDTCFGISQVHVEGLKVSW